MWAAPGKHCVCLIDGAQNGAVVVVCASRRQALKHGIVTTTLANASTGSTNLRSAYGRQQATLSDDGETLAGGWQLWRFLFETTLAGVDAAGDVRSGSTKHGATAVGEGAMAVQLVHAHLAAR